MIHRSSRPVLALMLVAATTLGGCSGMGDLFGSDRAPRAAAAQPAAPSVTAALQQNDSFDMFARLVNAAGLAEELRQPGPFTLFAPTDQAFERLPEGAIDRLTQPQNREMARALVRQHLIRGQAIPSDQIPEQLRPAAGNPLQVALRDGRPVIQSGEPQREIAEAPGGAQQPAPPPAGAPGMQATVPFGDIRTQNGIVHALDTVLLPPEVDRFLRQ